MKVEDLREGMYVEVTDKYRSVMLEQITWGKGYGKVSGFETQKEPFLDRRDGTMIKLLVFVEWADGFGSTISAGHLQLSTKKAFFKASLSC